MRCAIRLDGHEILKISDLTQMIEGAAVSMQRGLGLDERIQFLGANSIFGAHTLFTAINYCLAHKIDDVLVSECCLVRALGMLDARLGKRRLATMDIGGEPEIVRRLWLFRCYAERLQNFESEEVAANLLFAPIPTRVFSAHFPAPKVDQSVLIARLADAKLSGDMSRLLARLERDELSESQITGNAAKHIYKTYTELAPCQRPAFIEIMTFFLEKTSLLESEHAFAICEIANSRNSFIRPLLSWKRPGHNADKQLSSLLRHLFARYDVPAFMESAWLTGNRIHQQWYLHLGRGENIRTAEGLPIKLTRAMAHAFLKAPDSYSINAALRWAQITALGGDRALADALLDSRLVEDFTSDDFWVSVLQFFVRNPMIDSNLLNPIVDFIVSRKFEQQTVFTAAGVAETIAPPQPNFSMKGRTAASMIALLDQWHQQLGRITTNAKVSWSKCAVKNFQFVEGSPEARNMRIYTIRELLSNAELIAEGKRLRHCVGTYVNSCVSGAATIWSLEVNDGDSIVPLLTIELRMADLRVRQVRGKFNRRPTQEEKLIMQRWASAANILIESYI